MNVLGNFTQSSCVVFSMYGVVVIEYLLAMTIFPSQKIFAVFAVVAGVNEAVDLSGNAGNSYFL